MISASFNGTDQKVVLELSKIGPNTIKSLVRKITYLALKLQQHIQVDKLQGQVLSQRTGKLIRSIEALPTRLEGSSIIGEVKGGGGVAWYGRIHEYGGSFIGARTNLKHPPHLITRKGGERVLTGSPYGVHYPERSFMRSAFTEMQPSMIDELRQAISAAIKGESNV